MYCSISVYHCIYVCLFVWWCLTPLSTIFQLYRGVSFIGGGNRRTQRKPPTFRKSMTNIMVHTSPWSRFELTTSVVIGTDYIGSCKSNYHTITATTAQHCIYRYIYIYIVEHIYFACNSNCIEYIGSMVSNYMYKYFIWQYLCVFWWIALIDSNFPVQISWNNKIWLLRIHLIYTDVLKKHKKLLKLRTKWNILSLFLICIFAIRTCPSCSGFNSTVLASVTALTLDFTPLVSSSLTTAPTIHNGKF